MKPLYVLIEDNLYESLRKIAFDKHVSLAHLTRAILRKVIVGNYNNIIIENYNNSVSQKTSVEDGEKKKISVEKTEKLTENINPIVRELKYEKEENRIDLPEPVGDEYNAERLTKANFVAKGKKRII